MCSLGHHSVLLHDGYHRNLLSCSSADKLTSCGVLVYVMPGLPLPVSFTLSLEQSIERQVLHSQCRRLEVHHYNLSVTAEQLSHSMGVRNTNANLFDSICT